MPSRCFSAQMPSRFEIIDEKQYIKELKDKIENENTKNSGTEYWKNVIKSGRIIFVKLIVYDSLKDLSHNRNYTNLAVIIQIGAFSLFDRGITFVDLPHDVLENFCGGRKIRMRHLISNKKS